MQLQILPDIDISWRPYILINSVKKVKSAETKWHDYDSLRIISNPKVKIFRIFKNYRFIIQLSYSKCGIFLVFSIKNAKFFQFQELHIPYVLVFSVRNPKIF